MWQESGLQRESRTSKCVSSLLWLGERDHADDALDPNTATTPHQQQSGNNGRRFTHTFSREWAVPEDIALLEGNSRAIAIAGTSALATTGDGATAAARARGATTVGVRGNGGGGSPASDARPKWAKPLTDLSLSIGDMVCVSAQGGGRLGGRGRGGGLGGGLDHVRLLTGTVAAVYEDKLELWSDRRMRVPRRGGRRDGCSTGGDAGEALDIEDLFGKAGPPPVEGREDGRVLFRVDKDEWAAGIK